MYMRFILSFLKEHCTFHILNYKYLPQEKKCPFVTGGSPKYFALCRPGVLTIRKFESTIENERKMSLPFFFFKFYHGSLVVQARYHLEMLFEGVVLGSGHPSSCHTIMTSDISL